MGELMERFGVICLFLLFAFSLAFTFAFPQLVQGETALHNFLVSKGLRADVVHVDQYGGATVLQVPYTTPSPTP